MSRTWRTLKIGAGGFTNNFDMHANGTKVTRTDTMGAWIKRPGDSVWSQLVTFGAFASGDLATGLDCVGNGTSGGVYEIRIAPSDPTRLYMYLEMWNATAGALQGYVYRSNDTGRSWTVTNFPQHAASGSNQVTEGCAPFMAIDPANADVVYVGTPSSGLFKSTDGGVTASSAIATVGTGSTFPGSGQGGGHLIVMDPSLGTSGSPPITQSIYVSTYGTGVYHSTNGGTSWTKISGSGTANTGLTTHQQMVCTSTGIVYLVDNAGTVNIPSGFLNRYSGGSWSQFGSGSGINGYDSLRGIAVDPANVNNIVTTSNIQNALSFSNNAGSTWTVQSFNFPLVATDIPWLAATNENPFAFCGIMFDPSQSNVLYFGSGIGVFKCSPSTASTVSLTSENADIEQLVVMNLIKPPGSGGVIVNCMDRPVFALQSPNSYPSQHGMTYTNIIVHGIHSDWASSDPTTIITNTFVDNGYSATGGGNGAPSNWHNFGGTFPGGSGSLAAASPTNFVFVQNLGGLWVTTNTGATWSQPASAPTDGWGSSYNSRRYTVCADRVNIGTFYAYNQGTTSTAGVYRSTNNGATWALASNSGTGGHIYAGDGIHVKMKSVPGNAGHLFWCAGQLDDDTLKVPPGTPSSVNQFFICTNALGACTFAAMTGVRGVYAYGFGKALASGHYPSVYIYGFVDNGSGYVGGVWRCDDAATSPAWTQVGDLHPMGHMDRVNAFDADMDTFGTVYVGFIGSGCAYLSEDIITTNTIGFSVITDSGQRRTRMIGY